MYSRATYRSDSEKDWTQLSNPVASAKKDGANFWMVINSEGEPSYISRRQGVDGKYPDRTSALPHLYFKIPELAGSIYNCELFHSGHHKDNVESHGAVSSILNSLPPKAIETQSRIGPARAVLHNSLIPDFPTYKEKLEHLKKVEKLIGKPELISAPEMHEGHEKIKSLIEKTKREGREGVIVTSLTVLEPVNYRVKIKHKIMHNLVVSGFQQAVDIHGNPKEEMGALIVKDATGKVVGKVGTGFSRNDRIEAFKHPERWLGRAIQVESLGWAVNALRMPVYNGDADGHIDTVV